MLRFVAGVLVGVCIASTKLSQEVNLNFGFYNVSEINKRGLGDLYRMMYVAGVMDGAIAIDWYLSKSQDSYEEDHKRIKEAIRCLRFRGRSLGQLQQFADSVWRDVSEAGKPSEVNAAAALIVLSCEQ